MSPAAPSAEPPVAEPPVAEDRLRVPAVPASSLVLVRPGAGGETSVFTVRRAGTMAFSAHADEYLRDLTAFRAAAQVEESKDNIL